MIVEKANKVIEAVTHIQRDESLEPLVREGTRDMAEVFSEQGELFLERLESQHRKLFAESDDVQNVFEYVFEATIRKLGFKIGGILERAFYTGMDDAISDFDIDVSFNLEHPRAEQFLKKRGAELVTGINETTRDSINRILVRGRQEKKTYAQVANEIKGRFREFAVGKPQLHIRSRAELVSVTENAHAYGEANSEAAEQLVEMGIEIMKYWSNVGDARVSDGCRANSAAGWIDKGELFPSGDNREPRFPGCRCKVLYERKKH